MNDSQFVAFSAMVASLGTLLAVMIKGRRSRKAVEELRAEKANTDYVQALEGRINVLEKHVSECEGDRVRLASKVEFLTSENWNLTKRMVENLMDNSKSKLNQAV